MNSPFAAAIIGIILVVIGISNMKGNISSLHRYHRNRVSEEDRIPFGKKVGLGTVIAGGGLTVGAVLALAAERAEISALATAGNVVLIAGLVVGLGIAGYAMIKYNKGIF